jgi:hypothetical protein
MTANNWPTPPPLPVEGLLNESQETVEEPVKTVEEPVKPVTEILQPAADDAP